MREVDWAGAGAVAREYLCVEPFLAQMTGARALSSAFEVGLVDLLGSEPQVSVQSAASRLDLDLRGMKLLLDMLRAHGVVEALPGDGGAYSVTPAFEAALRYRDLLEVKLWFANQVAPDVSHLMTALLFEPGKFKAHARIFNMFSYQHAIEATARNYEQTAGWMRLTTALTRHETPACMQAHDFSGVKRLLDIGGNSGEFALQLCRAYPALRATVYDLPLVCDIGARHVGDDPAGSRVGFERRDPASPAFPKGHDLVVFKSMLHDWPDAEVDGFLRRAWEALEPGARLMIFERSAFEAGGNAVGYGQWPLMLFFRSYRSPQAYHTRLEALGFHSVETTTVPLDMPFMLMTAVK